MELFLGSASLVVSFLLGVVIYIIKKETNNGDIVPSAVVGAFLMLFLILGIDTIDEYRFPSITPMDVYRGKTTLEITYRGGIAIDTTVVWKEEIK